jgi:HAD superfamily phosphatase (TIGR01668 family)
MAPVAGLIGAEYPTGPGTGPRAVSGRSGCFGRFGRFGASARGRDRDRAGLRAMPPPREDGDRSIVHGSIGTQEIQQQQKQKRQQKQQQKRPRTNVASRLLQSVNVVGISSYVSLLSTYVGLKLLGKNGGADGGDADLDILPALDTPDIRNVDWGDLFERGFRGVIFDKDHTLTLPYAQNLHPYAAESLERAKSVFGGDRVVLYSNSAGLRQYDPEGSHAEELERSLGVRVLRHGWKKPYVSREVVSEIEEYFGCGCDELVMVGDRYMTDVVFGNRLGMMTVRVKPFVEVAGGSAREGRDPASVKVSRKLEEWLVDGFRNALENRRIGEE